MKEILQNLANIHMIEFAKKHNIDISNTYVVKIGRGFTYGLVKYDTNKTVITVHFNKSSVPTFTN